MNEKESGHGAGQSADMREPATNDATTGPRPALVINPLRDRAFAAVAESLLDDGLRSVSSFQDALRGHFPDSVVHARELSGETDAVWYLFRDGRWVNGKSPEPVIDG